jgi:hypothetical protein
VAHFYAEGFGVYCFEADPEIQVRKRFAQTVNELLPGLVSRFPPRSQSYFPLSTWVPTELWQADPERSVVANELAGSRYWLAVVETPEWPVFVLEVRHPDFSYSNLGWDMLLSPWPGLGSLLVWSHEEVGSVAVVRERTCLDRASLSRLKESREPRSRIAAERWLASRGIRAEKLARPAKVRRVVAKAFPAKSEWIDKPYSGIDALWDVMSERLHEHSFVQFSDEALREELLYGVNEWVLVWEHPAAGAYLVSGDEIKNKVIDRTLYLVPNGRPDRLVYVSSRLERVYFRWLL